ncbi:MAG: DMT family transporter [Rhizobiaceae bacterium]
MHSPFPAKTSHNRKLLLAYILGVLGVTAFGATLPVTRLALIDFTPEFLTFARAIFASLLAIVTLLVFRKPLRHKNDFQIFLAGIFLIFTFPGFMAIAMKTVPAAHGGVVLGFLPLATAVISRMITDEKPSGKFWLLSLAGALIVVAFTITKSETETGSWIGYAWLCAAGITAALGYVIFGKLSRETPGWEIISRSLVLNLPFSILGAIWFFDSSIYQPSQAGFLALLYLGSFSMFLAFCAWNVALAIGGIARIGQLQLLQVFVTIAVAALLLGEKLDSVTLVTALAITVIIAASRKT